MEPDERGASGRINWTVVVGVLAISLLIGGLLRASDPSASVSLSYTEFKDQVRRGNVSRIIVKGQDVSGSVKSPIDAKGRIVSGRPSADAAVYHRFQTMLPSFSDPDLVRVLEEHNVDIRVEPKSISAAAFFWDLFPWLVIIGAFVYLSRRMTGRAGGASGGGGVLGFGKSRAKVYTKSSSSVTFDDVAGLDNAKNELEEIVDYLKAPSKFGSLGGKLPRGVLLVGPPGTGKTLLARAVAGEANVPFYSVSASEFVEMFVGVGASRVRDLFTNAKQAAPSIIFIDELDSIGRARGVSMGGGQDEREQTLNQILSEMDGFAAHVSVVVMAATNRPDVLDAALVRPGRFDRQVTIDLPHKKARRQILQIHSRNVPLGEDVNLDAVAQRTAGFSGADLQNLVNEAALLAARREKSHVEAEDFEQGRDKIILGIRRDEIMSDEDKRIVAYHEAGHAMMAILLPRADPLERVTIIPRSRALGATEQTPTEDRQNLKRSYLIDRLAIMLGGHVAERLVFDDVTTGAADDLRKATILARRMVCNWGMSETLGPVTFVQGEPHPFLGGETAGPKDFSEHTAQLIDEEVRNMVREMEEKAKEALTANRPCLDALAGALVEHETLSREEVDQVLQRVREAPPGCTKAAI